MNDDGAQGQPRSLGLDDGAHRVDTLDGSAMIVTEAPTAPMCASTGETTP